MKIETKIRFEDGGVTITQSFDEPEMTGSNDPQNAQSQRPQPPRSAADERIDLPESFKGNPERALAARPAGATRAPGKGGDAELPSPGSGGGGAPLTGALTVVFGSLIVRCEQHAGSFVGGGADELKLADFAE